jgi:ParB-like chromosome segregation protein Spo0J
MMDFSALLPVKIPINEIIYSTDKYNKYPHLVEKQKESDLFRKVYKSIAEDGLKNPLLVHPKNNGKYQIYIGNNRLTAAKLCNYTEVDCIIGTFTREEIRAIKANTYQKCSSDDM